ncbi:MAG: zinc ABC transporter substrate-binding protein, partial [Rhodothermales bacterium]|nr:zinc ABC transporter substrate-binding protein [Rhodothermales bacterium]
MRNSLLLSLLPGVALGVAAALAGCGDRAESAAPDGRLDVVATTNIVADLVREIGGEYVNAEALMGPGVDPHLYKASEGDVARLTEADAIFYNGLDLEGKMADVLERLGDRAVAVTDGLDRGVLLASNHRSFFDQFTLMLPLWGTPELKFFEHIYFPVRSNFFYETRSG